VRRVNLLALLLAGGLAPTHAPAQGPAEGTSSLTGRVQTAEGQPVQGVRVLAYHVTSQRLFRSEPTRGDAEYRIAGLTYGYVDLAVETAEGLFVADRVLNLAPAQKAAVILTILPAAELAPARRGELRQFPGAEGSPLGLAQLREKLRGREFWRSPMGVAILAGAGGAALLAIASGSDEEPSASVFVP
jgi:hypothetical protein